MSGSSSGPRSGALFERARAVIPGGVNSPVRSFASVGGTPAFLVEGSGAYVTDVDGVRRIDYVMSWGPLIAGHAHPEVVAAVCSAAARGTSFGAPTEAEVVLAEEVTRRVPAAQMMRMVSSGTEATMSALRLARAATGRELVVKFSGCYHGHVDALLASAGSAVAALGLPDSPGVPAASAASTIVVAYNDAAAVRAVFAERGEQIAAVIVEPVAANMGVVPPAPGFLTALHDVTRASGALLIVDEVLTGFRVGPSGAIGLYGLQPDLVTFGKVLGGGVPAAAYAGRRDLMRMVAPEGPVYQAGTLSGNPLATAAGLATLQLLDDDAYRHLVGVAVRLTDGLREIFAAAGVGVAIQRVESLFSVFFTSAEVDDYAAAQGQDAALYSRFYHAMSARGVALPPSAFEAWFVSLAHTDAEIDATLAAASDAVKLLV